MTNGEGLAILLGIQRLFSYCKDKLLKPKNPPPLDDHSVRQKVIIKNSNVIIVNSPDPSAPEKHRYLLADLGQMPDKVIKALEANFKERERPPDTPEIRLISSAFEKEITDYEKFLKTDDKAIAKILPYLRPDYASILELASYAKEHYDNGERHEGDLIKDRIGDQYGKYGRKLCNLVIKGYIMDVEMSTYVGHVIQSTRNRSAISEWLNGLISEIRDFAEDIHFIHRGTDVTIIAARVAGAMKSKKPYVAMHSAGSTNISITEAIIERIGVGTFAAYEYELQRHPIEITGSVPFFDVIIVPIEPRDEGKQANQDRPTDADNDSGAPKA
jgi:hypothetical protein